MPPAYDENLEAWCEVGRWVMTPVGVAIITAVSDTGSAAEVHLVAPSGDDRTLPSGKSDVRQYARSEIRRARFSELPESRRPVEPPPETPEP